LYKDHRIALVVPAYNEEKLIGPTLAGLPDWVDRIFVVDDGSADGTRAVVEGRAREDPRLTLIVHERNQGLGRSLVDGYLASSASDADITAVMAGDNQMDPADLPALLDALIERKLDYVKGNRLLHPDIGFMPPYRFVGNAILTILTKFATGYYSVMDPQCGYTAIWNATLKRLPIRSMTSGYGYNADLLCMLNIGRFRVGDVEVRPVYGPEQSKIILRRYIPRTSWLLIRLFFRRLWQRYVVRDFHPLVLFFWVSVFNILFIIIPFTIMFLYIYFREGQAERTTLIILVFTIMTTVQLLLFAIWMDMDYNR